MKQREIIKLNHQFKSPKQIIYVKYTKYEIFGQNFLFPTGLKMMLKVNYVRALHTFETFL